MRRLLIRPGGIGDCITCLPVMKQLGAEYTEVWVPSAVVPLVQFADRVQAIAATGLDLLGLDDGEPQLRLRETISQFDSIISWYGSNRAEFRALAPRINPHWEFLPALPAADSVLHATDFHARNAGLAMGLIPQLSFGLFEQRQSIVIHPFSGGRHKNWPMERFRELAKQSPFPVEWIAGPEEELPGAYRFDDLMDLASWIGGARLYVGNDSGITHLAAATGIPTVALFGDHNAHIWRPRGQRVTVIERSSVAEIEVQDVLVSVNGTGGYARPR